MQVLSILPKLKQHTMSRYQILFVTTLLISLKAFPQLDKKMWLVGGNGSFKSYVLDYAAPLGSSTINFLEIDASAKVGYFVLDKFVLGITPTYYLENMGKLSITAYSHESKFSVGPFARYYLLKNGKPFNILTEINYQIGFKTSSIKPRQKGSFNMFSFFVGPELYFNPTIGIEVLIGYRASKGTIDGEYTDIRKGFQVAVGFQMHLEK